MSDIQTFITEAKQGKVVSAIEAIKEALSVQAREIVQGSLEEAATQYGLQVEKKYMKEEDEDMDKEEGEDKEEKEEDEEDSEDE
jgi:stringent starvation protein B